MGLNQKISLILQAEDKGQAAFASFLKGMTGLGGGAEKANALLQKQMAVSNSLAVAMQKQVIIATQLSQSNDKIQLSQDRATLAAKQYSAVIASQTTLLQANAAAKAKIDLTQAKLASANTALGQKQYTAQVLAPQGVDIAAQRYANAQVAQQQLQAQIAKEAKTSPAVVASAAQELRAAQVDLLPLADQLALQTKLAAATGLDNEQMLALTRSEQAVAAGARGLGSAFLAADVAQKAVLDTRTQIATLNTSLILQQGDYLTATQLATQQDIEATTAKTKYTAAIIAQKDAQLAQQTSALGGIKNQNTIDQLTAQQKALSPANTLGTHVLNLTKAGATATGILGLATIYEASKKASAFTSQEAQIAAATGTPLGQVRAIGQAQLDYAALGHSQYSEGQLLQGAVVPLNLQLSPDVVAKIVPIMAQAAAVVKSPDLVSISQAVIAQTGYLGQGKRTSAAAINQFLNTDVLAENRTGAPPGAVIAAIPSLLAGINQSGIGTDQLGMDQALGLQTELVNATGISPQKVSTWLGQMIKSAITKPQPTAITLAKQLGISQDFGTEAFKADGSDIYTYLAKLSADITGPNKSEIAQKLFGAGVGGGGINAAKAFLNLTAGNNLYRAAGFSDQFNHANGIISTDTNTLLQGQQQQQLGLLNHFNSDLTTLGISINQKVVPQLLKMGDAAVTAMQEVLDWGKATKDNPAGGTPLDTLMHFLTPGDKGFGNIATARDEAARHGSQQTKTDSGRSVLILGGLGIANDFITSHATGLGDTLRTHLPYGSQLGAALNIGPQRAPAIPPGTDTAHPDLTAPGRNYGGARSPTSLAPENGRYFGGGTPGTGRWEQAVVSPLFTGGPGTGIADGAVRTNAMRAQTQADEAMQVNILYEQLQKSTNDTAAFRLNLQNFQDQVKGVTAGTSTISDAQLAKMAQGLLAALKTTSVLQGLGPSGGRIAAADTYTIGADLTKVANTRQLDAANIAYNNALAQQTNVGQEKFNLAANNAAAVDVYNKQLALIAVEAKTGQLKKTDAATQGIIAQNTEHAKLVANLNGPLSEAQAKLQLSQATGLGIPRAEQGVAAILKQQAALGGIGPEALALQLYQLNQTVANVVSPGPQLIRANVQGLDQMQVGFTTSASRISQVAAGNRADRALANAEATIQALQQALTIARQQLAEDRANGISLRSIDKKTPDLSQSPPPPRSGVSAHAIRIPVS